MPYEVDGLGRRTPISPSHVHRLRAALGDIVASDHHNFAAPSSSTSLSAWLAREGRVLGAWSFTCGDGLLVFLEILVCGFKPVRVPVSAEAAHGVAAKRSGSFDLEGPRGLICRVGGDGRYVSPGWWKRYSG